MMDRFNQTYSYKLIYVFSMPYDTHKGLLKVGEATLNTDIKPTGLVPNCHALNQAAKARIDSYTKTAIKNIIKRGDEQNRHLVLLFYKPIAFLFCLSIITLWDFKSHIETEVLI